MGNTSFIAWVSIHRKIMFSELQTEIIQELARLVENKWDIISVNVEIDEVDGELVTSPYAVFIRKKLFKKKTEQFRLNIDIVDCLKRLRSSMAGDEPEKKAWKICQIEVQSSGKYNFSFSYDEPPRLATLKRA